MREIIVENTKFPKKIYEQRHKTKKMKTKINVLKQMKNEMPPPKR